MSAGSGTHTPTVFRLAFRSSGNTHGPRIAVGDYTSGSRRVGRVLRPTFNTSPAVGDIICKDTRNGAIWGVL